MSKKPEKTEPAFKEGYSESGDSLNFLAEAKLTKQVKANDLSQRYTIVLETNNPNLMDLGKLPYDTMFEVTISVSKDKLRT